VKSFDPKKVEVQVHQELESLFIPLHTPHPMDSIIKETINGLVVHAMNLRRDLATLYECEIEDTEIILDVEDETKLTMTARLKER
jgi:hypothetical protein